VKKKIKKSGKQILLLLLVMLVAVPVLPVSAAEDFSSRTAAAASALEGMETPSSLEGDEPGATPSPEPESSPEPVDPEPVPPEGGDADEDDGDNGDDIPEGAPSTDALPLLVTGGHDTYLSGYAGAVFKPDNPMMRGEVAYMFYKLLATKPPVSQSQFTDVSFDSWWGPAINCVAKAGAFHGMGNDIFAPSKSITRAEFVTALTKCFGLESGSADFSDVSEDHWAYPYIASAVAKGWISGFGDGTFKPNDPITRCQAVTVMNSALGRRDGDFAKDRAEQKFYDVPSSHWAYLEIAEAAKPVEPIDPEPQPNVHPIKKDDVVVVTADDGLNVRQTPSTSGNRITTVSKGTLLTVTDTAQWPWVHIKMNSGKVGYVHSDYVKKYDGGTVDPNVPVVGSGATLSTGRVNLHQYQTFRLDASVTSGMDAMVWKSSDPSVAEVGYTVAYNSSKHGAMVYGKKPGTATLTFSDRAGTTSVSCTVTVSAPEAVRFAYSDAVSVGLNVKFNLVGITDPSRSAVRFEIVSGPAKGTYTTNSFETKTASSTYGLPNNTVRVFRANVSFGVAGNYTVRAYSADASGNYSKDYKEFAVRVNSASSVNTVSNDSRVASAEIIKIIAGIEGFVPEIEDDQLARGNPTVGHGYVVPVNHAFYNTMTKEEAFAQIVDSVSKGEYAAAVEKFRSKYGIRMSQGQFDALVSFAYNLGPNIFQPDQYYTFAIMLNAVMPPSDIQTNPRSGYLNVGNAPIYTSANVNSSQLVTVPNGKAVTVSGYNRIASDTKHEMWYKVSYNGTTGWMPAGYVRLNIQNPVYDMNYIDSTVFAYNYLQWHTADHVHYKGLLRRRMAELKIFFFGNYAEANTANPNYTKNTYGFIFPTCCTS